jgi:hypothetical protein
MRSSNHFSCVLLASTLLGCSSDDKNPAGQGGAVTANGGQSAAAGSAGTSGSGGNGGSAGSGRESMSFFVTSRGGENGGNLGGLDGADALCTTLASAVSATLGAKTWHAYLSVAGATPVNARERIGQGPWRNANGVVIANDLTQLHDQSATGSLNSTWPLGDASIPLDEQGNQVPNSPVLHDILTGTNAEGNASGADCSGWTSTSGTATNGHSNRTGGGVRESWTSAHTIGCGPFTSNFQGGTVSQGGGRGSFYCFAVE